jgi:2,4-dienoyl-CoA reductase-like NADH-dependent reductase (Old Yellow Enzyme family)
MVIVEGTAVEPGGRITAGDLGLWDDATEAALVPILKAIRAQSKTAMAIQLAHAGRKGSSAVPWAGGGQVVLEDGGWITDAPSAIPQREGEVAPRALDRAGMDRIRDAYAVAARRAARLGFDALDVHGGHGYLIHEFLSPIANQRTDNYGGSIEKRMRYPLEIVEAVRAAFPADRPVGIKVSASDWLEGGVDLDQTIAFAAEVKARGIAWMTASSGGVSPLQKIKAVPGYQLPFAEGIRKATGLPAMAIGLITEPTQAEAVIADGVADLVAIARGMLYDPRWGWRAAAALGGTVEAPPSDWRAPPHDHRI